MRTIGLSPKLYPSIIAIVTGVILLVVGKEDAGLAVILTGVGGLGLGAALPPGQVEVPAEDIGPATKPRPKRKPQAGYALIEVLLAVLIMIVILALVGVEIDLND